LQYATERKRGSFAAAKSKRLLRKSVILSRRRRISERKFETVLHDKTVSF